MMERAIVEAAFALRAAGEPFVVATVVAVTGSAYRRPGARMLVARDRWVAGSVSGGCLEGDVLRRGWWRTQGAAPIVVTYDSTVPPGADPDELREGLGLGCNGIVDVLLERDGESVVDVFGFLARCRERQQRGALITVFHSVDPALPAGSRLAVEPSGACTGWLGATTLPLLGEALRAIRTGATAIATVGGVRALVEAVVPPPRLFVIGKGHDAAPLAALGRAVGWDVMAAPASTDDLVAAIDASDRAACVVMNHNYARDVASLGAALESRAAYIGVLGPRHRTDAMLDELGRGHGDPRLHAPVGLALGAETPAEIALAITAEVQAVLRDAPATSLRERRAPIHAQREGAGNGVPVAAVCEAP